jgi:hypothetical protein
MGAMLDLRNKTFGELTALKPVYRRSQRWCWLTKCSCGTVKVVRASYMANGIVTTCGDRAKHPNSPRGKGHSYTAVHWKISAINGPASAHLCKCGAQAQEWAHKWGCDHERLGERGTGAYCSQALPECYVALCVPCHRFVDNVVLKHAEFLGRV